MRFEFTQDELNTDECGQGLEIGIVGFKTNPTSSVPDQIYIEVHNGKLRIHVWDGTSEDPRTIEIKPEEKHLFYSNHYYHCDREWVHSWHSSCNDTCLVCGGDISPYMSVQNGEEIIHSPEVYALANAEEPCCPKCGDAICTVHFLPA
jgi:hypothetical protein